MSGRRRTRGSERQSLYRIAHSIGQLTDEVVRGGLRSYIDQLSCAGAAVFRCHREEKVRYRLEELVVGEPTELPPLETLLEPVFTGLAATGADPATRALEIDGYESSVAHLFELRDYGVMVLVTHQESLSREILSALPALNATFARRCREEGATLEPDLGGAEETAVAAGRTHRLAGGRLRVERVGPRPDQHELAAIGGPGGLRCDSSDEPLRWLLGGGWIRVSSEGAQPTSNVRFAPDADLTDDGSSPRPEVADGSVSPETVTDRERLSPPTLFENHPLGITICDADGNILSVNETQAERLGYGRETIRNMHVADYRLGDSETGIERLLTHAGSGDIDRTESINRRADGTVYPVESWLREVQIEGTRCYMSIDRDISQQVEIDNRLERKDTVLRTILDTLPVGILVESPDGEILSVNRRLVEVFDADFSADSIRGQDCQSLIGEQCSTVMKWLSGALADSTDFLMQATELVESGTEARKQPFELEAGGTIELDHVIYELPEGQASLWMFRDVTDRVERNRELQSARRELRRSNEKLEKFAYAASHDLKEPLRAVSNYLTLIRDGGGRTHELDDRTARLLDDAVQAADRMGSMIDALLEYSRIDSRADEPTPTSLEEVVRKATLNLTVRIEERDASIQTEPLPSVIGDEQLLTQLFQNLLDNAIKYNDTANPRVSIGTGAPIEETDPPERVPVNELGELTHVRVQDNGRTMDQSQAERAFDVFERLGNESEEGAGMGLPMCRRIVEFHGGDIWIEAGEETGSIVHLMLPSVAPSGAK